MTYRGVYDSATQYEQLDVVRYQSAAYLALTDVIGEAPGTSAKWGLIAQDGVYSAVAGNGISLSGNTISIVPQLLSEISSKVTFVETNGPDTATENGVWYKVHPNAGADYSLFAISTTAQQAQFRIKSNGTIGIRRRYLSNGAFPAWGAFDQVGWKQSEIENMIATYLASVKIQTITAQSTHDQIPTAKAVYDYAASKASYTYLNNQYIELENDVNQLPTTADVQQMIDNSIGGVLSGEY